MFKKTLLFLSAVTIESKSLIALKQQNLDILHERLSNISDPMHSQYTNYMNINDINTLISPSENDINNLLSYFDNYSIHCARIGGDALECDNFNEDSLENIPPIIEFIENKNYDTISNVYFLKESNNDFVGREVINNLYNITYDNILHNSSLCAVEYQSAGGFTETDLFIQQKLNNQPKNTIENIVGNNEGMMIESQLDIQMMSQVAQNGDIWFWQGDEWLYTFAVKFLNSTKIPEVLSMSWGWSTRQQCSAGLGKCLGNMTSKQYIDRVNTEYIKMGLLGITVTVSSGDSGAPGRTNEICTSNGKNVLNVNPAFPGSSPYITSVSATYLVPTEDKINWKSPLCKKWGCANGKEELPCNFDVTGWTTGGGFAIFNETRPEWQSDIVEKYLKSEAKMPKNFEKEGRGYPDVSALGHNCPVVVSGEPMGVDGTSCSSPIFASIVALLNDYQISQGKNKLGFMNPLLYNMYRDNPSIFNDIKEGNNWCTETMCCNSTYGYEAWSGWDPVTGLGTPNVGKMIEWLDRNT